MSTYTVSYSALVAAPPARVYSLIADYKNGHPRILPRPPFGDLMVEQGGVGAGTVIRFQMTAFGRTYDCRGVVTEPEPGRVLVESYPDTGIVTTFRVEPRDEGRASQVTILTESPNRGGLLGAIEKFLAGRFLRKTYVRELQILEAVARETPRNGAMAADGS